MTTDSVVVRPLQAADLAAVSVLEQQLFTHPWNLSRFETALKSGYLMLGCEIESRLVGYLVISQGGGVADLLTVGVDASLQGSAVATRLLDSALAALRQLGVDELLLEVRATNQRAICFYRKSGFDQVGLRKNYYQAESGREDAWVFKRTLDA